MQGEHAGHDGEDERKSSRVSRSQLLLVSAHVFRLLLSIAIISILGRTLPPADFGFVALVTSLYIVAMEFLDMGTTAFATREIAARPDREREMLTTLLALRRRLGAVLLLAVMVVAASGMVVSGEQQLVLGAAAIGLHFLYFHGYQVVFQVRQSYGQAISLGLAGQLGFLVASIAALKLHASGAVIALLVVVRELVLVASSRWVAVRMLGYRLRAPWRQPGVGALLRAGWMIGVAGVCYKVAAYSGGFFLWGLASPEALASFSAAQRLLVPMADMAWLFATPLIASMSAAIARGPGDLRAQLEGYAKLVTGLSALVAVAGYFLAPFFLRLLYGEQYASGPWSSVGVFRWLALGYVFALVTPVLAVGELARGNARPLMVASLSGLGLNLAVNAGAVPLLGAEGAAVALVAGEALVFVALFARAAARRDLGIDATWTAYLLPAIGLLAILSLLGNRSILQLLAACAWAPVALVAILQLPAQKACRASLAAVSGNRPPSADASAPPTATGNR